jgi:hypothetical protein
LTAHIPKEDIGERLEMALSGIQDGFGYTQMRVKDIENQSSGNATTVDDLKLISAINSLRQNVEMTRSDRIN